MTGSVAYSVAILAVLVAAFAAAHTLRQPFSNPLFYATAVLEVALLGCWSVGAVAFADTSSDVAEDCSSRTWYARPHPARRRALGRRREEPAGTGVVTVAMLTVAVLCVRALQISEVAHA